MRIRDQNDAITGQNNKQQKKEKKTDSPTSTTPEERPDEDSGPSASSSRYGGYSGESRTREELDDSGSDDNDNQNNSTDSPTSTTPERREGERPGPSRDRSGRTSNNEVTQTAGFERMKGAEEAQGEMGDQARRLEDRVLEENPDLTRDDVRVRREDDTLRAELTQSGVERREQEAREANDRLERTQRGAARAVEQDKEQDARRQQQNINQELASLGLSGEQITRRKVKQAIRDKGGDPDNFNIDVQRTTEGYEARIEQTADANAEQFGDFAIGVPGTDKRVEDYLDDGAARYDEFAGRVSEFNTKYNPSVVAPREVGDFVEREGPDWLSDAILDEEGKTLGENFVEGAVDSTVQLGNVPQTVSGAKEGVELVGWTAAEAPKDPVGTFGAIGGAAATAAGEGYQTVRANPARATGQLAGSLVASSAIMGGAARVSSKAGRASRYAIQPGEEIVSDVATAAARRTSVGQRALDKVPGGRLDNEELVIAAGRRYGSPVARKIRRAKYDAIEKSGLREFAKADRAQAQLAGARPRSVEVEQEVQDDYSPSSDLLDDSLTQTQDQLRSSAQADFDADRAQYSDFGEPGGSSIPYESPNDRLTFDPDARQSRRRSRSLQEPELDIDTDTSADWGRAAQAESEFERDSMELDVETEQMIRAAEAQFVQQEQAQEPTVRTRSDFGTETGQDLDTGTETGFDTSLDFRTDFETDTDTAQDFETDFRTEFATETDQFVETETETESELEYRTEFETESESEANLDRLRTPEFTDTSVDFGAWEKRWKSGIKSSEEVWEDEFGGL